MASFEHSLELGEAASVRVVVYIEYPARTLTQQERSLFA